MQGEDTTIFEDGRCSACGATSHTLAEGGQYCDQCARRVTFSGLETSNAILGRKQDGGENVLG